MVSVAETLSPLPPQWCQWPRKAEKLPELPAEKPSELPATPSAVREPVYKVVEGTLFERATTPYSYVATIHPLGNGMVEAGLRPQYGWSEVDNLSPAALADFEHCQANPVPLTEVEREKEDLANRVRSTRRARSEVRRKCKHRGLIEILTLTYRENMQDRNRMSRDLDAFIKRVHRRIPHFEYVCVFEQQKRGAWHAHLAVKRVLPFYWKGGTKKTAVRSFDLLRSMWRGVVGNDNGNIDVSKRRKQRWSPAKIAGYISKYVGKSFGENAKHENSYSASNGSNPDPVRYSFDTVSEGMAGLFALLSLELEHGDPYYKLFPDTSFWMSVEPRTG